MSRLTEQDYRNEARAWRQMATEFLMAKRSGTHNSTLYASGPKSDKRYPGSDLSFIAGVCLYLDNLMRTDTVAVHSNGVAMIRRMRRRIMKHKPKGAKRGQYWWQEDTRRGQRQRVAAILKCAAECDALGGEA